MQKIDLNNKTILVTGGAGFRVEMVLIALQEIFQKSE